MQRRSCKALLAVAASVAVLFTSVAPASGNGTGPGAQNGKWPVERANPGISKTVIDSLPDVVKRSNVKIDPEFRAGSPIMYPNGDMVPGQNLGQRTAQVQAACTTWFQAYGPFTGSWGATSQSNCAVFGSPGYLQPYEFNVSNDGYSGCTRARGYNSSGTATWYGTGCGTPGQNWHSYTTWGNVLAYPAAQARSLSMPAGFLVDWRQLAPL